MIHEVANKDIQISKIPMNTDDIDETIPAPLPKVLTHFMVISGPPGSGKTNLMVNLIGKKNKNYYGVFDRVYFISPSQHTIGKKIPFNPDRCHTAFSEELLNSIIEQEQQENNRCLLILDDVVAQITKNMKAMLKFIYNRRHIGGGFSVWCLIQKWNKLPLELRTCCTHATIFKPMNKKEVSCFYDELSNLEPKDWHDLTSYCWKDKHDFIFYDVAHGQYYRNFNKIILHNSNDRQEGKEKDTEETQG